MAAGSQPFDADGAVGRPDPAPVVAPPPPPPQPTPGTSAGADARGAKRRFVVDAQPRRKNVASCRCCREPFAVGDLRCAPKAKASCGGGWFVHVECIADGLRLDDTVEHPGLTQDQARNLRARLGPARTPTLGATRTPLRPRDAAAVATADASQLPESGPFEDNVLRNLQWWDAVDLRAALQNRVPTWEAAHPSQAVALVEAKTAVMSLALGDGAQHERAWRLLLLMDRLIFAKPASHVQPDKVTATQFRRQTVARRLRLFWRGDWQALWEEAHVSSQAARSDGARDEWSASAIADRVAVLLNSGEASRAIKEAVGSTPVRTDAAALPLLRDKFPAPTRPPLIPSTVDPQEHAAFWNRVADRVRKVVKKLPKKSGPALGGSRFEHWQFDGAAAASSDFVDALARVATRFAQGMAPSFVYDVAKTGRLLALAKSDGGVRPLTITTVLRRIAFKALVAELTEKAKGALGDEQYAIGRSGAVDLLTHTLQADACRGDGQAVAAVDLSNAFGAMDRKLMVEELLRDFPALATITGILYGQASPLLWEDADHVLHDLTSSTGIDQGCPLSLLAFCFGMRSVVRRTRQFLQSSGPDGVELARTLRIRMYVDDLYLVCDPEKLPLALTAFAQAASEHGLEVNEKKLQFWGLPADRFPEQLRANVTATMLVLGNLVERTDGHTRTLTLGDVRGSFAFVYNAVRAKLERLWVLHAEGGLSLQITQALGRVIAQTAPQHILRGSRLDADQKQEFDGMLALFWARLVGETDGLGLLGDSEVGQILLPQRLGGMSAGGVAVRADAAFLSGALEAKAAVADAVGAITTEDLWRRFPAYVDSLNAAVTNLEHLGVEEDLRLWEADQPQVGKGRQRVWTRAVADRQRDHLLATATPRRAATLRSAATSEGSRFLGMPTEPQQHMSDAAFRCAARRRLGLPPLAATIPAATTCQNVRADGSKCGHVLDAQGHHASTCEAGGALLRRHNAARDCIAKRVAQDLAAVTATEQHIPELDRPSSDGNISPARLDVVVTLHGARWLLDVAIVSALSADSSLEAASAGRDGHAAMRAEDRKRRRYPHPQLVPLILEAHGRFGDAGLAWLRRVYAGEPLRLQALLTELSVLLQSHTASMVLAATTATTR